MSVIQHERRGVSRVDVSNRFWGYAEVVFIVGLWVITLPRAAVEKIQDRKRKKEAK